MLYAGYSAPSKGLTVLQGNIPQFLIMYNAENQQNLTVNTGLFSTNFYGRKNTMWVERRSLKERCNDAWNDIESIKRS